MKRILLLAILALPALADPVSYVATSGNVSLSSQSYAVTLQQPTSNSTPVTFPRSTTGGANAPGATVYCSAACVLTIYRSGNAATTTAGTVTSVNQAQFPASVNFYTASNGGITNATTLAVINVAAGSLQQIDLSAVTLGATNLTTTNLTFSIASVTATVNITFYLMEQH